jgi:hypothetical protein
MFWANDNAIMKVNAIILSGVFEENTRSKKGSDSIVVVAA